MCGIAAVLLHPQDRPGQLWQAIKRSFSMNLIFNEQRGAAATGIAVLDTKGAVALHKSPLPASLFIETPDYEQALHCVGSRTSLILGHTRLPTKGDPRRGVNNHPIRAGTVVGVHNGEITNDDELFGRNGYERTAEVDSEIIFRLIESADPADLAGRYLDEVRRGIQLMKGEYTFLACDQRRPERLLVLRHGNPLFVHFQKEWNAIVFSSRYAYLRSAFGRSSSIEAPPMDLLMLFDAGQIANRGCSPAWAAPLQR